MPKLQQKKNAVSGFAGCGMWPLDQNVFDDSEFVCLPNVNMDPTNASEGNSSANEVTHGALTNINDLSQYASKSTDTSVGKTSEAECSTSSLQERKCISEISSLTI
ncbi:hypothetical protein JTB14_000765 [Gonioctena quinquepunctata]|nr:hypothetical protein JTB14_000765 [Gonioctena quinquepunctata]